jgi:hypothetical protein
MPKEWQLRSLRGSRSGPPGQASSDPYRRSLYGASLEQFEQLLVAARAVGPAARPLPLFYALSQAGRAIVAAFGDQPDFMGHGLAEVRTNPQPADPLHRKIRRSPKKGDRDAFGAVGRAIGSADLVGDTELGALWAILPGTHRIPEKSWQSDWRPALVVLDETSYRGKPGEIQVQALSLSGNPHLDEVSTLRDRYPSLPPDARVGLKSAESDLEPGNWIVVLVWDEETPLAGVVSGTARDESAHNLVPTLPGQAERPAEILIWWALLYGLSLFARYSPGLWMAALAVDHSDLAVPLEGVLEAALTAIPALVHKELQER